MPLTKLLIVTPHYPPKRLGGTELHARKIATWYAARNVAVSVICVEDVFHGEHNSVSIMHDRFEDVTIHRLNLTYSGGSRLDRDFYYHRDIQQYIEDLVVAESFDLINLISGYLVTGSAISAARASNTPIAVTLTDYWFVCPRINLIRSNDEPCGGPFDALDCTRCLLSESRRYRLPEKYLGHLGDLVWQGIASFDPIKSRLPLLQDVMIRQSTLVDLLNSADVVILPTNSLRRRLLRAGVKDSFAICRHGIDHEHLGVQSKIKKSDPTILRFGYLGQVLFSKGVDLLVEAFKKLTQNCDEVSLDIFGSLENQPKFVSELRKQLATTNFVGLWGRYEPLDVAEILSKMDILVVPSRWPEIGPLVLLEALATKTPVIAARVGNMPELIQHGVNGLLFEPNSVEDLYRQMQSLVEDPHLLSKLVNGIEAVRTSDQEMMELDDLFNRVICSARLVDQASFN